MPLPQLTLVGNLTADPELRYTQSGKPVTTLRIAANERRKNEAGEWVDGDTTYLDAVTWRNAEAIASALHKGQRVMITGTLKQRSYETATGEKRNAYEVNADFVAQVLTDNTRTVQPTQGGSNAWANTDAALSDDTPF